jgi:hypothetical protein
MECGKKLNYICEVVKLFDLIKTFMNLTILKDLKEFSIITQVRQTGTYAQALQKECMDVWNVSIGIVFFKGNNNLYIYFYFEADMMTFEQSYNASTIPRNLRVKVFICLNLENFICTTRTVFHQMHWRKHRNGLNSLKSRITSIYSIYFNLKYSFGGLTPSTKTLRIIEEICNGDDVQLQTKFDAYDGCSSKGWYYIDARLGFCGLF